MKTRKSNFEYSEKYADIYAEIGLSDTTYEIGYSKLAQLLGSQKGMACLDFGCGTGRSSELLYGLGAKRIVAVDHDVVMIARAKKNLSDIAEVFQIKNKVHLDSNSIDTAISISVFIEIRTLLSMKEVCAEIFRVLKPNGKFFLMTTNPAAFGKEYLSFSYEKSDCYKSGLTYQCKIKGENETFVIEDTYWSINDYLHVLDESGFVTSLCHYPDGNDNFMMEMGNEIPPFLIISSRKPTHKIELQ